MGRTDDFPKTSQEGRRKQALELRQYGWKPCEIAAALGVSAAAVSQWVAEARARGREAWRAKPRLTGPVKLTSDQLQMIPDCYPMARKHTDFAASFGRVLRWRRASGTSPAFRTTRPMSCGC
jgi:transposase